MLSSKKASGEPKSIIEAHILKAFPVFRSFSKKLVVSTVKGQSRLKPLRHRITTCKIQNGSFLSNVYSVVIENKNQAQPTKTTTSPHLQVTYTERGRHTVMCLTYLATPPTVSRKSLRSNHVLGVFGAFSKGSPPPTPFILISAIPTSFQLRVK